MFKVLLAVMFASTLLLTGCKIEGAGGGSSIANGMSSPDEGLQGSTNFMEETLDENPVEQQGSTSVIPEPATLAIFSLGLAGLAASFLRKRGGPRAKGPKSSGCRNNYVL